jgi:hypothetical protein
MIALARCIFNARHNVFPLKRGVVFQNFFNARTSAEQLQDIGYSNSHPSNARATSALRVVDRYALLMWIFQVQPMFNILHLPHSPAIPLHP